jgi:hypothetical protein
LARTTARDPGLEKKIKRQIILERGERCEVCGWHPPSWRNRTGSSLLQMHHITPVCRDGSHEHDNIALLCPNHHALAHLVWPNYRRARWCGPESRDEFMRILRRVDADPETWPEEVAGRMSALISED